MQPTYLIIIKHGFIFLFCIFYFCLASSSLNANRSVEVWDTVYAVSTTQILFTNSKHIGEDDMPDLGLAYVRVIVQETWGQNTMNGPYY